MKLNRETIIASIAVLAILICITAWLMPSGLSQAPSVAGKTLDNRTLTLKQLRGKPVLITFWATSCPSCIKEIPHLIKLYREFRPKGLEIIGVAMAYDPPQQVRATVKQRQIPYPIILDKDAHIAQAFDNVRLTPTSVLVSPKGRIIHYQLGPLDMSRLRNAIADML
ncbi:MAG: redoxin [Candidatus Contendobacter odensis]|uniref:Redoxin n=1 Tax=Candidatus Contendibacter odensensis TaxID=1400860 RepID=A0A2G6PF91_9GAMM|nr:MAG: redoxin [Candidatus Contendobacter odensis]